MDDDLTPTAEYQPPYSEEFIAHLHGGAYEDHCDRAELWSAVLADPAATHILGALGEVTALLRTLAPGALPARVNGEPQRGLLDL